VSDNPVGLIPMQLTNGTTMYVNPRIIASVYPMGDTGCECYVSAIDNLAEAWHVAESAKSVSARVNLALQTEGGPS
jgi:hypothetical protein